jgi:hypothetical protein
MAQYVREAHVGQESLAPIVANDGPLNRPERRGMSKGNPHASARRLRKAALSTTVYGGMENAIIAVLDSLAALTAERDALLAELARERKSSCEIINRERRKLTVVMSYLAFKAEPEIGACDVMDKLAAIDAEVNP